MSRERMESSSPASAAVTATTTATDAATTAVAAAAAATDVVHHASTDRSHLHSHKRDRDGLITRDRSSQEQRSPNAGSLGLNLPRLGPDGSTHSLTSHSSRVYEQTPPAALSTLGIRARMMQREMDVSHSTGSLTDSQYDMIDDLSEISDDHETASLTSNDTETSPDGESEMEEDDQDEGVILETTASCHESNDGYITLPSHNMIETGRFTETERQHDIKRENDLLDSYMSEDLETPRQSTLSHNLAAKVSSARGPLTPGNTGGNMAPWLGYFHGFALLPTVAAILLVCLPYTLLFALRFTADHPSLSLAVRRESLMATLTDATNVPSLGRELDVEHLLPHVNAECVSTDIFGRHSISPACKQSVRYQGLPPNLMIVAFPGYGHFPGVVAAEVVKGDGRKIDFNRTELIEGVHAISFDPQEAFGFVTVEITTKKPAMDVQASHNYGSRMLQRKTYENAGADVSNAVSKEVAVMREAARTLTGKVSSELKVGYRATKSVTTELALAMSRDLQVFAGNAVSAFSKAAQAGNDTATALTKDLVLLQQDLVRLSKNISGTVASAIRQARMDTKTALRNPLARSREHLLDLGHAFGSIAAQHNPGNNKEHSSNCQSKINDWSSRKSTSDSHTSFASVSPDEATQPSRQYQRQATRARQQIDRVHRHIERKEQEFRETGHRELRKEIRQLKKEYKERNKALKKLLKETKHR